MAKEVKKKEDSEKKDTSSLSLLEKIFEVQCVCDFFKKEAQGHNYKYVDGMTILSEVRAKMDEVGLMLETHLTGDFTLTGNKNQFFQRCEMVWLDPKTGDQRAIPWVVAGEQQDISKAFGSGLTYCQRYFILKYFNCPSDEDDPDNVKNSISYGNQKITNSFGDNTSKPSSSFGTGNDKSATSSGTLDYTTFTFPFGKYRGQLVSEFEDSGYLSFIISKCNNENQKVLFEKRVRELGG